MSNDRWQDTDTCLAEIMIIGQNGHIAGLFVQHHQNPHPRKRQQQEEFNSDAERTVAVIRQIVCGDTAMLKAIESIAHHVSGYDYERGLAELAYLKGNGYAIQGCIKVSPSLKQQASANCPINNRLLYLL